MMHALHSARVRTLQCDIINFSSREQVLSLSLGCESNIAFKLRGEISIRTPLHKEREKERERGEVDLFNTHVYQRRAKCVRDAPLIYTRTSSLKVRR